VARMLCEPLAEPEICQIAMRGLGLEVIDSSGDDFSRTETWPCFPESSAAFLSR
jgi:hypothetical protein